jgi:hypothetical protein
MSTYIYLCLLISIYVYLYLSMSTYIYLYLRYLYLSLLVSSVVLRRYYEIFLLQSRLFCLSGLPTREFKNRRTVQKSRGKISTQSPPPGRNDLKFYLCKPRKRE